VEPVSFYDPYAGYGYDDPMAQDPMAMAQGDPMMEQYLMMMMGDPAYADVNAPTFDQGQLQALMGMVPDFQPNGRPLTVSNQTSALNANRSALFDTLFAGFGGPDAFSAEAFAPTTTTEVVQSPELQTIYGYLRAPESLEGRIALELMEGGTPATAVRKMRQLLAEPNVDPALKEQLLLELPPRRDEFNQPMEMLPDGSNVNWDIGEDSVTSYARSIGEQWAGIPLLGPTSPTFDPVTQTWSGGGERAWSTDETGAPIMIETRTTESPAAQKFTNAGLPSPFDEYTAEDFMDPNQVAMQQALAEMDQPVAQAKAAWMDPSLAPTNAPPQGPATQPAAAGWGGPGAQAPAAPRSNEALWEESLLDVMGQNPTGDTGGWLNSLTRQGMWDIITGNEGAGQPGGGPRSDVAEATARNTATLGGDALANVMLQNPSGDTGGWWNSFTRQGIVDILTGNEGGGGGSNQPPSPDDYAAGDPATYAEFLANQPTPPRYGAGNPWAEIPPPEWQGAAPNALAGAFQSLTDQGLPPYAQAGAQPANQPGGPAYMEQFAAGLPAYAQPGAMPANQPGGPAYMQAIETGERRAQEDEQRASVLSSGDRTGKRKRPTRTGEQARQYRQAFEAWDAATDQQQALRFGSRNFQSGQAMAQARNLQDQGVRPLQQALMARRLMLMGAGMPNSGYIPGT
jgi:hypothetical protein